MKLKINKKYFNKQLEEVVKIINHNSALISLQGLLIEAREGKVILTSSNGNLSIKKEIEVDVDLKVIEPGTILVPGKIFKEIIKKQSDEINISVEGTTLTIESNGSKATINLFNKDEYPTISFDTFGNEFEVDVSNFKDAIKNVSYASAENDKRLILNGVNIKANNSKLFISATNSFRLAYEVMNINSQIEFDITILSQNLKEFLPSTASKSLKIAVNDSKIITSYDNTIIVSNLIDGIYPELGKLIPQTSESTIEISTNELNNLIDKVLVMSTEKKRVSKLTVSQTEMILEMKRDEVGELIAKTSEYKLSGSDIVIPFDITFLKEAVSRLSGDIQLCFNGSDKPFIVKSNNKKELIQLVLPHRSY